MILHVLGHGSGYLVGGRVWWWWWGLVHNLNSLMIHDLFMMDKKTVGAQMH